MKQDQLNAINIYQNIMPDSTCEYLEKAKKANIGTCYIQDKCFANYDKLIKEIDRLANLGVKVKIMMTSSSVEKAYQRMLERGERTGRYVDEKYFYEQHRKVEKTFSKLLKNLPQNVVLVR